MTEQAATSPRDQAQHEQRLGRMLFEQFRDPASLAKAANHLKRSLSHWQEAQQPISEAGCWSLLGEVLKERQALRSSRRISSSMEEICQQRTAPGGN